MIATLPVASLTAGLPACVLLAGGLALGWVRAFWQWIYNHTLGQITQRVSVSVTVEEQDHPEAFLWLSHWAERKLEQRRVSLLQLRRRRVRAVLALLVWLTVMIQTGGK